ncbi:hypothetical protein Ddye_004588 [Dipteronia dyeriana]|uniref:Light-regulated protein n=1 Tax=Dipteronia dyeriana TaxID=168575 RepID=A0AAD9XUF6_9ROSI|nr:hypothetical protein Ddye_004588 [Dipteronia dyeriana]
MQAALCIAPPSLPLTPTKNLSQLAISPLKRGNSLASRCPPINATAATNDSSTFDYSSAFSVFPAEACETIGGEACLADMYPEAKIKPEARNDAARIASEVIDREYLEYNEAETVFKGEACDNLGGIFCGLEYQRGVY